MFILLKSWIALNINCEELWLLTHEPYKMWTEENLTETHLASKELKKDGRVITSLTLVLGPDLSDSCIKVI